jgi:hypothetical protein
MGFFGTFVIGVQFDSRASWISGTSTRTEAVGVATSAVTQN